MFNVLAVPNLINLDSDREFGLGDKNGKQLCVQQGIQH